MLGIADERAIWMAAQAAEPKSIFADEATGYLEASFARQYKVILAGSR